MSDYNITDPEIIKMLDNLNEEERKGVADQIQKTFDKLNEARSASDNEFTPEEFLKTLGIMIDRQTGEDKMSFVPWKESAIENLEEIFREHSEMEDKLEWLAKHLDMHEYAPRILEDYHKEFSIVTSCETSKEESARIDAIENIKEKLKTAQRCWGNVSERLDWLEERMEECRVTFDIDMILSEYEEKFFALKHDNVHKEVGKGRAVKTVRSESPLTHVGKVKLKVKSVEPMTYSSVGDELCNIAEDGVCESLECKEHNTNWYSCAHCDAGYADQECVCDKWICDGCLKAFGNDEANTVVTTKTVSGIVMCESCMRPDEDVLDNSEEALLSRMCDEIEAECFGEDFDYDRERMKKTLHMILDTSE